VIVPLAASAVVFGLTRVQQGLLIALDAPGRVSIVEIGGTAASVLAYLTLIPPYGMLGAAYGSIIGYSVCAAAGAYALIRVLRSRPESSACDGLAEDAKNSDPRSAAEADVTAMADAAMSDAIHRHSDTTRK